MSTWPDRPLLLDGGMGRELRTRGVEILDAIWSANGLLTAPKVVRQIHQDYIKAGADVITTNTFRPIAEDWTIDGDKESDGTLPLRDDLDPASYAQHALAWLEAGANIVGGCCGTGPAHIAAIRKVGTFASSVERVGKW